MRDLIKWLEEASNRHNNYRCADAADVIVDLEDALNAILRSWDEPCFGDNSDRIENIYEAIKKARLVLKRCADV
jgi:hypothetical protein